MIIANEDETPNVPIGDTRVKQVNDAKYLESVHNTHGSIEPEINRMSTR